MRTRHPHHQIAETRDWARIVLAAGVGIALVILSLQGELSAAVVGAAAAIIR